MVLKVNNQLMPFSSFGGSRRRRRTRSRRRRSRSRRNVSSKRSRTRRSRTRRRRRRSSSRRQRGGFIRAHSRVFNWGDKCQNTGKQFNLEK